MKKTWPKGVRKEAAVSCFMSGVCIEQKLYLMNESVSDTNASSAHGDRGDDKGRCEHCRFPFG